MKTILLGIIFVVMLAHAVAAAENQLMIQGVDVKVDSKTDKDLLDGDTVNEDVKPGSTVTFKITFYNNYTREQDLEIRDISTTVTIQDIDDGDDLEEEADEFDLNPDDDKTVSVKFEIPLMVSEDTYDVIIEAEGRDQNRTTQKVEWHLYLEVIKDRHNIIINKAILEPSTVKCSRDAALRLELMNFGRDTEEEVKYTVGNAALGLSASESEIEMSEDPDDDNYEYVKTISFKVADDVAPGVYPITIKTYYDTDRLSNTKNVDLVVEECPPPVVKEEPKTEEITPSEETTPPEEESTVEIITPPVTTTEKKAESFYDSTAFLAMLIGAEILIVLIGIILVIKLLKK